MTNVSNWTLPDLENEMLDLIGKTHLKCGFPLDMMQVNETIGELCEDIKKYNGGITFTEIELAFKNGYKEVYGKFYGLNNKTYFMWINAYHYGEKRAKVKKQMQEAKDLANAPSEKKSQEEIDEIMKCGILKSFEDFKKGAVILDAGNCKYSYLEKKGVLKFSKERKEEILEEVEEKIKFEARENKKHGETITQALSKITKETIISRAKTESLKYFFGDLLEIGTEISELI